MSRATWDAAQGIGAQHSTSRDGDSPSPHPRAQRTYMLRGRVRCRPCRRRMYGITRASSRYYTRGPDVTHTYYLCPHDPRHQAQAPGHPATVSVREDVLIENVRRFFATRLFGPDRATLLAEQLPAGADIGRKLTALAKQAIQASGGDPALLDRLPMLGDALGSAPDRLKQKLFDAFDIQALYSKAHNQVTLWATITPATPAALAAIIADSETPDLAALLTAQDHPSDLARQPGATVIP